jgi:hypothetical protein
VRRLAGQLDDAVGTLAGLLAEARVEEPSQPVEQLAS